MKRDGFTLIELILVIAILGILAVSAMPKFIDVSRSAEVAVMLGTAGAVRSGISLYRANAMIDTGNFATPPASLNDPPASCCFGVVLENAVDTGWETNGEGTVFTYERGQISNATWTYNPATGSFTCSGTDCQ